MTLNDGRVGGVKLRGQRAHLAPRGFTLVGFMSSLPPPRHSSKPKGFEAQPKQAVKAVTDPEPLKLSGSDVKILEALASNPAATLAEICSMCGLSWSTVQRRVARLKKLGAFSVVGVPSLPRMGLTRMLAFSDSRTVITSPYLAGLYRTISLEPIRVWDLLVPSKAYRDVLGRLSRAGITTLTVEFLEHDVSFSCYTDGWRVDWSELKSAWVSLKAPTPPPGRRACRIIPLKPSDLSILPFMVEEFKASLRSLSSKAGLSVSRVLASRRRLQSRGFITPILTIADAAGLREKYLIVLRNMKIPSCILQLPQKTIYLTQTDGGRRLLVQASLPAGSLNPLTDLLEDSCTSILILDLKPNVFLKDPLKLLDRKNREWIWKKSYLEIKSKQATGP